MSARDGVGSRVSCTDYKTKFKSCYDNVERALGHQFLMLQTQFTSYYDSVEITLTRDGKFQVKVV